MPVADVGACNSPVVFLCPMSFASPPLGGYAGGFGVPVGGGNGPLAFGTVADKTAGFGRSRHGAGGVADFHFGVVVSNQAADVAHAGDAADGVG